MEHTAGMPTPEWEATWKANANAFDRVRAVVLAATDPQPAGWIADHANVAESTARDHLDRLSDMGVVRATDEGDGQQFGPDPGYVRFREIRELTNDHERNELSEFVVELKESITTLREAYDPDTPDELRAAAADPDVSAADARDMQRAAADWEHYRYRLSLLEDAISRYNEYTESATPA